jgi:predicted component of type VI protein secretion system
MGLPNQPEPMQLELRGDVVLGRGGDADIDLTPYDAERLGVSRSHAMLRPTASSLFLLDLESTNGTQHNTMPLGPGSARRLEHNDGVALGQLSFVIKIVSGPTHT